jgi:hypothetical protein
MSHIAPEMMGMIYANRAGREGFHEISDRIRDYRQRGMVPSAEYWTRVLHSFQRTLLSRKWERH